MIFVVFQSLKDTVLLCCEAFCKCLATDGYFLHVDVACKLYGFLAKLDCSLPAVADNDDGGGGGGCVGRYRSDFFLHAFYINYVYRNIIHKRLLRNQIKHKAPPTGFPLCTLTVGNLRTAEVGQLDRHWLILLLKENNQYLIWFIAFDCSVNCAVNIVIFQQKNISV